MPLYGEDERRDSRYMDDDEYRRMREAEDDEYEYHGDAADDEEEKETVILYPLWFIVIASFSDPPLWQAAVCSCCL